MNKAIIMVVLLMASIATAAEWQIVNLKGGEVVSVSAVANCKQHTIDPDKNEYPMDYKFPQTNMMYWVKVGNDWVVMSPAEQAAVNESKKKKVTDEAVANIDMDALFKAIAESIKNNDKTYEAVKANFKAGVDPVKADKKDKEKSK